jgi:apolipoprotein N-acyltransferase
LLGIFRFIAIRFQHWIAVVFFAFSWTSYEFVVSLFSNHGTGGSIAYTQVQNLPIIQIASITGIWGITFLLIFMPASVAFIWHYRRSKILTLKIGVITIAIAVLTIGFGVCRMYLPKAEEKVTVGLANFTNKDHPFVKSVVDRYDVAIASLAEQGAKVVILPEEIVYMQENTTHRILRHFCVTARKNNVYLIVGLNRKEHDATYNSAYVFSPDGKIALRYDKQHLIPFGEEIQYTPGTTLGIFHTKEFGPLGVAICKDMDFVYPALQYSQQGIGALFVPAWDFGFDRWIHGRMALMRGVEGGFSIVRAAQDGLLTISDSRGQIIAYAEQKASSDTTLLIGDVPIGSGHSPYSYLGNWFAWTGLLFLAAMFAKALMMIFRPSSQ